MPVLTSTSLGDLVTADPRRSRVLEGFGLDYCCNGHRTLADAARDAGLDVDEVSAALDLPDQQQAPGWTELELTELANHIVDTHHAYLWEEMPRLQVLVEKVAGVHGGRHPELAQVRDKFAAAVSDLAPHLMKEERILFPGIAKLEEAGAPVAFPFGALANPINQMLAEHDVVGEILRELRELTNGFAMPEDGCASYRAMLTGLEEFETDLHEHIHKENNVLFPRVLQFERQLAPAGH